MRRLLAASIVVVGVFVGCASGDPVTPKTPAVEVPSASSTAPVPRASTDKPVERPATAGTCASDADCAPAECCHPKTCVLAAQKTDCSQTMCTRECRGGTFDYGGGGCLCRDGQCIADIHPRRVVPPPP
jgi:hypothetical protein